jgi:phosphoglycerol transferase
MERTKTFAVYTFVLGLCMAILIWVMNLWKADLAIPFNYDGDGLLGSMLIKGIIDNGWYLRNPFLGMPEGMQMFDFPLADSIHLLLIKMIIIFTGGYAKTLNIFFLLTFPLTTLVSLYTFRSLKLSFAPAVVGSILYTFLPYHF